MASQVLSGSSNPSYTNNTGQNVRVVINFMVSTPFIPRRFSGQDASFRPIQVAPAVPATLTINWAGVSVSVSSPYETITIGRNLAYSQIFRDLAVAPAPGAQPEDVPVSSFGITNQVGPVAALASSSNNASGGFGRVGALPTELMLAPGQTFSAVCSVHNIVVIPENG